MTDVNGWVGGLEVVVELGRAFTFAGRSPKLRPRTSVWVASPLSCVATLIGQLNLARNITNTIRKAQTELGDERSKWHLIFF
jgi:hypothetical protein